MAKKKSGNSKSRKPAPKGAKKSAKKSAKKGAKPSAKPSAKKAAPRRAQAAKLSAKPRPTRKVEPPPPPPPRPTMPAVVHWEVQARDPAGQSQFFSELFGWNVDANNEQQYGMVQPGGAGSIGGGIAGMLDAPRTTFYVQVPDINETLVKAESLGAQTILPRTDMGMIVMGQFRDREGNLIGLVEPWTPLAP